MSNQSDVNGRFLYDKDKNVIPKDTRSPRTYLPPIKFSMEEITGLVKEKDVTAEKALQILTIIQGLHPVLAASFFLAAVEYESEQYKIEIEQLFTNLLKANIIFDIKPGPGDMHYLLSYFYAEEEEKRQKRQTEEKNADNTLQQIATNTGFGAIFQQQSLNSLEAIRHELKSKQHWVKFSIGENKKLRRDLMEYKELLQNKCDVLIHIPHVHDQSNDVYIRGLVKNVETAYNMLGDLVGYLTNPPENFSIPGGLPEARGNNGENVEVEVEPEIEVVEIINVGIQPVPLGTEAEIIHEDNKIVQEVCSRIVGLHLNVCDVEVVHRDSAIQTQKDDNIIARESIEASYQINDGEIICNIEDEDTKTSTEAETNVYKCAKDVAGNIIDTEAGSFEAMKNNTKQLTAVQADSPLITTYPPQFFDLNQARKPKINPKEMSIIEFQKLMNNEKVPHSTFTFITTLEFDRVHFQKVLDQFNLFVYPKDLSDPLLIHASCIFEPTKQDVGVQIFSSGMRDRKIIVKVASASLVGCDQIVKTFYTDILREL
uniref:Uncharacterized protein n=1 Tax=Panagrolaimus sp. ES5 TaxID=591445 RepID=A0AC34F7I3_9BILA